jgi:hypothetical protein
MTEDEYGALLRHVYEFSWHVAVGSCKSADPILQHEHFSDAMGDFKN